jgi:hypothetical protein
MTMMLGTSLAKLSDLARAVVATTSATMAASRNIYGFDNI